MKPPYIDVCIDIAKYLICYPFCRLLYLYSFVIFCFVEETSAPLRKLAVHGKCLV